MVSFDVFGTALVRQLVEPDDIHYLTANRLGLTQIDNVEHYVACRRDAENRARKKAATAGRQEVGIAEISSELEEFLPPQLFASNPIKIELKLEQELAIANPKILALHRQVRHKGLGVAFIADTSLPHGVVSKLLRKAGYDWDHLFLSSQTGRTKQDGSLFSCLVERTPFDAQQILHIGNDESIDVDLARSVNLRASLSSFDRANVNVPADFCSQPRTGLDSIALSLAADHQAKVADTVTAADVGYYSIGPMMSGFMAWVNQQCQANQPDHIIVGQTLHLGQRLASLLAPELLERIHTSFWEDKGTSDDIQPGDSIAVVDWGWDDRTVQQVSTLVPSEVSVQGLCLGLVNPPTTDTTGWAFAPDRNTDLAKRMQGLDFIDSLASAPGSDGLQKLVDEISLGILAFAEDFEPWIQYGSTSARLCWPTLRTLETPTFAEAQRLADSWADEQNPAAPFRSRLVRSVHSQPTEGFSTVWERGSEVLAAGNSTLPPGNRRLALRALRFGQRRGGTTT